MWPTAGLIMEGPVYLQKVLRPPREAGHLPDPGAEPAEGSRRSGVPGAPGYPTGFVFHEGVCRVRRICSTPCSSTSSGRRQPLAVGAGRRADPPRHRTGSSVGRAWRTRTTAPSEPDIPGPGAQGPPGLPASHLGGSFEDHVGVRYALAGHPETAAGPSRRAPRRRHRLRRCRRPTDACSLADLMRRGELERLPGAARSGRVMPLAGDNAAKILGASGLGLQLGLGAHSR